MTVSRAVTVAAAAFAALLLAGCAGSDSGSGSGPGSTGPSSPSGSTSAGSPSGVAVTWAGNVCSASTGLQESLSALTASLPSADQSSSTTSRDQARAEVRKRVIAVQQQVTSLTTTLANPPVGGAPELTALQESLKTAAQRAQQGVDQVSTAASQVADSQKPAETARALATLAGALRGAASDVAAYLNTLRSAVTNGSQAVKDTFSAAPQCQQVTATPT
jgi:hypothetical protein